MIKKFFAFTKKYRSDAWVKKSKLNESQLVEMELELFPKKNNNNKLFNLHTQRVQAVVKRSMPESEVPSLSFDQLRDHELIPTFLSRNITLSGYDNPTPIQEHAIPIALCGYDVMCTAQVIFYNTTNIPLMYYILAHLQIGILIHVHIYIYKYISCMHLSIQLRTHLLAMITTLIRTYIFK